MSLVGGDDDKEATNHSKWSDSVHFLLFPVLGADVFGSCLGHWEPYRCCCPVSQLMIMECMFSSLVERALACCWFVPRWMLVSSVSRSCAELLNSVCDSVVIYRFYSNEQFLLQETCVVVTSRNLNMFEDGGVVYFPGLSHSELVKNYNSVFFSF